MWTNIQEGRPACPWARSQLKQQPEQSLATRKNLLLTRIAFTPILSRSFPTSLINRLPYLPRFKQFLRDFSLLESQANGIVLPWSIVAEKRKLGVQLQLWEKLGIARPEEYDFISATAALSDRVAFDLTGSGHRDFETVPAMLTPLQMLTALLRTVAVGRK